MRNRLSGEDVTKKLDDEEVAEFILSEERTVLSKQRTALAFIQTGLAAIGVGLVVVKFWTDDVFRGVGGILIALGFYEIARSYNKLSEYNKRLERVKRFVKNSKWGKVEYGSKIEK
ncbi:Uncharacterised protein [uncultured archaeon]|nr:Uncharacterised protein [uncultured archaeon]